MTLGQIAGLALAGVLLATAIFRMTIWNQTIPDHLRGRLAGISSSATTGVNDRCQAPAIQAAGAGSGAGVRSMPAIR